MKNIKGNDSIIYAIKKLVEIVGREPKNGLSPFGHPIDNMNGIIDMNLLNGATELGQLSQGLSYVKSRKSDPLNEGQTFRRVREHINWMAKNKKSHGGFESRLAKIHGSSTAPKLAQQLMPHLKVVADRINEAFLDKYTSKGEPRQI